MSATPEHLGHQEMLSGENTPNSKSGTTSSALNIAFRPYGESLSLVCPRESNQREGHPGIRVSLRETSLLPVPLRGPAYKGRPWPFKPLAAALRLVPLRNPPTRPPDGDSGSEVPGGFSWRCAHCAGMGSHVERGNHQERNAKLSGNSKRPLQEAERNHCARG